ncbi:DUF3017 domain-containing protein, partial [Streptomyces sp. NPDC002908]|uniref:DUF3017 domain-containing protein n=1 Tax=Streptomyces sp. NPDC002908 TaxID=3364670 RepID=UPI0036A673D6
QRAGGPEETATSQRAGTPEETVTPGEAGMPGKTVTSKDAVTPGDATAAAEAAATPGGPAAPEDAGPAGGPAEPGGAPVADEGGGDPAGASGSTWEPSRRFSLTRDTARPEGGGRAAPGDAPAPARQWPLLTVLCTAGIGLLIVGTDLFAEAFRVGAMLMGVAMLAGAVLRWVVPSVGMLAVRSRFTDLVTYGLMGTLIVLLAMMAQPDPLLDLPFLQDVVHFTIR